jgi:hypothetical protein
MTTLANELVLLEFAESSSTCKLVTPPANFYSYTADNVNYKYLHIV